jgi:Toxin SymE, type I toxin-antitoxin system
MRRLTISSLRREWSNMYRTSYGAPVPYLRLAGNWLEQAGFTPGQKVSVSVEDRVLTITPEARPQ